MTAFVEPADRLVVPGEAGTPTKLAAYAAPRPQNDPAQAKVKQMDPGASAARKPAHRITSRLASSKRDMTVYHLPDGRQLRVFGRLSNNDGDDF
jgi:hypothetical protein